MRAHNFGAGPAAMPETVLQDLQTALWDWQGQGAGIAELNHRSAAVMEMLAETEALLRETLFIPVNYQIILTPIPARAHFGLLAQNLTLPKQMAQYIDSGHWAKLAMAEASKFVEVNVAAKGTPLSYPSRDTWQINPQAAYLHLTDNETIEGLSSHHPLETISVPVVADMTSSLLTRQLNIENYGMIYASAQKNLGLAGLCVLIIREDLLTRVSHEHMPSACHYASLAEHRSLSHTPPVIACYALNRTLHWLKGEGGVKAMEQRLLLKAKLIYDVIGAYPHFYRNDIELSSRSNLNIICDLPSDELTQTFLAQAKANHLIGLKGHGSRGGLRISLYNGVTVESAEVLQQFMQTFANQFA